MFLNLRYKSFEQPNTFSNIYLLIGKIHLLPFSHVDQSQTENLALPIYLSKNKGKRNKRSRLLS